MVRPKDTPRSWVIKWKGNTPKLEQSNWAPGYTSGHQETPQQAIAMEIAHLMQHIADFREKWLQINLLAEQQNHEKVSVTVTDDPHEQMSMPDGTFDVPDPNAQLLDPQPEPLFEWDDPKLEEYQS